MGQKVEVGGTGRDLKGGKALIGGTAYAIKKGRTLKDGTGYDISLSSKTPISELPVGNTVKIAVNGTLREFLIVNQGLPASTYDISCNGTWLLQKYVYERRAWNDYDGTTYKDSEVNNYLNSTFMDSIDHGVRDIIKQVSIPYYDYDVVGHIPNMQCKLFLLSSREVGFSNLQMSTITAEGQKLSYFDSGGSGNEKRIAIYLAVSAASVWWLRGGNSNTKEYAFTVTAYGEPYPQKQSELYFIRPAFILPFDTLVSDDGTITA